MKKVTLLVISGLLLVGSAYAQNNGGVAILDIDAVARELGVEVSVKNSLQTIQDNLNIELKKVQANFEAQLKNIETQVGSNPTDDQKRQMIQAKQKLNNEFSRLRQQAQQTLAKERVTKINQFREKLKPIALAAAKAKNLSVVMMKVTPPVYAYTDGVDITADTIDRAVKAGLKEAAPAPAPAPAPVTAPAPAPEKSEPTESGDQ